MAHHPLADRPTRTREIRYPTSFSRHLESRGETALEPDSLRPWRAVGDQVGGRNYVQRFVWALDGSTSLQAKGSAASS